MAAKGETLDELMDEAEALLEREKPRKRKKERTNSSSIETRPRDSEQANTSIVHVVETYQKLAQSAGRSYRRAFTVLIIFRPVLPLIF